MKPSLSSSAVVRVLAGSLLAACTTEAASPPEEADLEDAPASANSPPEESLDTARDMAEMGSCGASCSSHDAGTPRDASTAMPAASGAVAMDAATGNDGALAERGDGQAAGETPPAENGTGVGRRPEGVALCYTPESSSHPATLRFWEVMKAGDYAGRASAIDELVAAGKAHPDEEEFALLTGLASLWRVVEPNEVDDLLGALESVAAAESELARAYELCPTDHRIPGWLGPIKIIRGRMTGDTARVDEGAAILKQGIEHYPNFVVFSNIIAYADLPPDDPIFLESVASVRELFALDGPCLLAPADPACINTPVAAHNFEGGLLYVGDLYAKAQDREAALAMYLEAKKYPTWSEWPFQEVLEERLRTLDERMAAATTELSIDDLEYAWNSPVQCSLCHRSER